MAGFTSPDEFLASYGGQAGAGGNAGGPVTTSPSAGTGMLENSRGFTSPDAFLAGVRQNREAESKESIKLG